MARRFEVRTEKVWRLSINGKDVVDTNGKTVAYSSPREAWKVAENWDRLRVPTFAELEAMTDSQLLERL